MFTLEEERMSDFFTKYHLKGFPFDAVIHKFSKPDEGDPHDHPFSFRSVILKGGYVERIFFKDGDQSIAIREVGDSFVVPYNRIHRITRLLEEECWTMIMPEKWQQKSGFYRFEQDKVLHRYWDEQDFKPLIEKL